MKKGNKTSFSDLYKNNIQALLSYANSLTKDKELIADVLQDLFINIWIKRDRLGQPENIRAYLLRSIRNNLLKEIKSKEIFQEISISDLLEEVSGIEFSDQFESINQSLENLNKGQKEIVHLKFFQGKKNTEIAYILGIRAQSVSNKLNRALNKLRKEHESENKKSTDNFIRSK